MIIKLIIRVIQICLLCNKLIINVLRSLQGGVRRLNWKVNYIRNLYLNLKYLPYEQAVHVPIKWGRNVKILQLRKGQIKIENIIGLYQIKISDGSHLIGDSGRTKLLVKEGAELIFKGRARFLKGSALRVDEGSKIIFGEDFFCNKDCFIRSNNLVQFGQTCSLGWKVEINTTDGHAIKKDGCLVESSIPIILGDKVWVCSHCLIGKGVEIADHCIVAQGSVVLHKKFTNPYSIIHGIAASEGVGRYERLDF